MSPFALNVLLALLWAAINSSFSPSGIAVGFAVGFVVVGVTQPLFGRSGYMRRFWAVLYFVAYFLFELFVSSVRVALDVVRFRWHESVEPGIVAVPLTVETDVEITLLANVISLTPGTLSLDVSDDKRTLYVHTMYDGSNPDAVRREIKGGLEKRVLEVMR